jgi:hypothetical protein
MVRDTFGAAAEEWLAGEDVLPDDDDAALPQAATAAAQVMAATT